MKMNDAFECQFWVTELSDVREQEQYCIPNTFGKSTYLILHNQRPRVNLQGLVALTPTVS